MKQFRTVVYEVTEKELIITACMDGDVMAERDELKVKLEHHHGEPVALPGRRQRGGNDYCDGGAVGFNECLDEIAKLGPLYTHADAGEVERLRTELAKVDNMLKIRAEQNEEFGQLIEELKVKLSEVEDEMEAYFWYVVHDGACAEDVHNNYLKEKQRKEQ